MMLSDQLCALIHAQVHEADVMAKLGTKQYRGVTKEEIFKMAREAAEKEGLGEILPVHFELAMRKMTSKGKYIPAVNYRLHYQIGYGPGGLGYSTLEPSEFVKTYRTIG